MPLRRVDQVVGADKKIPVAARKSDGAQSLNVADPMLQQLVMLNHNVIQIARMVQAVLGEGYPLDLME